MAVWLCGCVALWLCGFVAVVWCVAVIVWLCSYVGVWVCGCVVLLYTQTYTNIHKHTQTYAGLARSGLARLLWLHWTKKHAV